jgi:hypothetical protein
MKHQSTIKEKYRLYTAIRHSCFNGVRKVVINRMMGMEFPSNKYINIFTETLTVYRDTNCCKGFTKYVMINQNNISSKKSAVLLTLIFTELAAHQFRISTKQLI